MKSNILICIIIGILLVSGGILYSKMGDRSPVVQTAQPSDHYYCPMHPQIQSDKPGTCPICYMTLVKKKDAPSIDDRRSSRTPAAHVAVQLTAGQQQLIGVTTGRVIKKDLTKTIHAYGYVAHDLMLYDQQLEYIQAWREYYAFVVRRSTKDNFRQDWRDYYISEPSAGKWRNEDQVKAQQRLIRAEYELRHMGLHDEQLAKLREIKTGQPWVQPDLLFFEEGHPTWVYAQIFESDLGFISVGQKAKVTVPAYNETVVGIVTTVANMIDPTTRTVQVRIKLEKYEGELTTNMYAKVEILAELNTALMVPREAVMDTGLNKIVFVQKSQGVFEPRTIESNFEGDGMVAIQSGLKEGETVVVSGNFLLDSESRLKAAIEQAAKTSAKTGAQAEK